MQEIGATPARVTALFCGAVGETWAENNCNITDSGVIVVAREQLDLARFTGSGENRRAESHMCGAARGRCCALVWRVTALALTIGL